MAKQEEKTAEANPDWEKRMAAGDSLVGSVGALVPILAQIERALVTVRPGRINAIDWTVQTVPVQLLVEQHAATVADLAGQLQKAAAEVVKLAPKKDAVKELPLAEAEKPLGGGSLATAGKNRS